MKMRLAFYCAAALMLAALVTPHASLAPAAGNAAQDRGRGKKPTSKAIECRKCMDEHREECAPAPNAPPNPASCTKSYDSCKSRCDTVPQEHRSSCYDVCVVSKKRCDDMCPRAKCKEKCEGVVLDYDADEDN